MNKQKAEKARKRHAAYRKTKNIVKQELREIRNGRRRGFSVRFPISRRIKMIGQTPVEK
jgi:hypothetical protein